MNEDALLQQLREAFRLETEERLQTLSIALLRLDDGEDDGEREAALEEAYRDFHSLKGAAHAVGLDAVAQLCQKTESLLRDLREDPQSVTSPQVDTLLAVTATVERIVLSEIDVSREELAGLEEQLGGKTSAATAAPPALANAAPTVPVASPQTPQRSPAAVRVSSDRLEALVGKAEELALLKLADEERGRKLRQILGGLSPGQRRRHGLGTELRAVTRCIRDLPPDLDTTALRERVMALARILEKQEEALQQARTQLRELTRSEAHECRARAKQLDDFLLDARAAVTLPFESLLQTFPPLVRKLASQGGKTVELAMSGQETEVDRRVLEELRDVLTHLVRNAVDHGIEPPGERKALGKPEAGEIRVQVSSREDGNVLLLFADDGRGLDLEQLRTQAVSSGHLEATQADSLPESEIEALAFRSGLSTSAMVTDVSGRGLGLAIVRERIERLGGTLRIDSRPGMGLEFGMELPVTTSSCRGVLVRAGGRRFVLPAAAVRQICRVRERDIAVAQGVPTVVVQNQTIPLLDLAAALQLPAVERDGADCTVAVLGVGQQVAAYLTEVVERELPVLLKPLGPQLRRVPSVSAVTVLANGELVPVLSPHSLLRAAYAKQSKPTAASSPTKPAPPKSLLVVEDSVTSRMLIKNILVAAGYQVLTAVDGVEGLALLKTTEIDLVVSDVEMPRMDGFQMTAAIRTDTQLKHVPVILITSLTSDEHRSRGLEVGANAYIVKGEFEQSNLLDTVRQLV